MASGWLWFFGLLWAYMILIFWLVRSGKMEKWDLTLAFGFALMIRTQKGKRLLEAIARPKRAWNLFGDVGIAMVLLIMAGFTFLMFLAVGPSLDPDSGLEAPPANEILVIPGVNPIVPLWYGLIGLIVTLVVHEGGHGILARANDLKVKSLGLLYAIVPIGAFVEPDEDELNEASRRKRLRVFSAGPAVNMVVGFLFLGLFVAALGAAEPIEGAGIASVSQDGPADLAGIDPGDTVVSIDGAPVTDWDAFSAALDAHAPGDTVRLGLADGGAADVTLGARWDLYSPEDQDRIVRENASRAEELAKDPVLGVNIFDTPVWHGILTEPFSYQGRAFFQLIYLPIGEVRGEPFFSFYLPAFLDEPFDADIYWPMVNTVYWIFWLNVLVGMFNALPMLPLDGGHIFRDTVASIVHKARPDMEAARRDRIVINTARIVSFAILAMILIQIFGPRLAPLIA